MLDEDGKQRYTRFVQAMRSPCTYDKIVRCSREDCFLHSHWPFYQISQAYQIRTECAGWLSTVGPSDGYSFLPLGLGHGAALTWRARLVYWLRQLCVIMCPSHTTHVHMWYCWTISFSCLSISVLYSYFVCLVIFWTIINNNNNNKISLCFNYHSIFYYYIYM